MDLKDKLTRDISARASEKLAAVSSDPELESLIASRKGSLPGSFADWALPTDESRIQDLIYSPYVGAAGGASLMGLLGAGLGHAMGVPGAQGSSALLGGLLGAGVGGLAGGLGQRSENAQLASSLRELGDPEATMFDMESVDQIKNRLNRRAMRDIMKGQNDPNV